MKLPVLSILGIAASALFIARAQAPTSACTIAAPCLWLYQGQDPNSGLQGFPLTRAVHLAPPQVFVIGAAQASVAASAPALWGGYMVWRNGVLQASGQDYTIAGQAVTFTPPLGAGDIVQVW